MLKVSIIIATYNRREDIKKVLDGLLELETDGRFVYEVLIVDNNSTDATKEVVTSYISKFSSAALKGKCSGLQYFFEPTQGKVYALNHGIKEAQGEIIALTDDDVLIDKNWIREAVGCFDRYNCDGVGGRVLPVYPDHTPKWIKREDPNKMPGVVVIYDYGEGTKKHENPMNRFIGANYIFKREVFDVCGLFREEFSKSKVPVGEDREFFNRVIKNNKVVYYCGQALVWHPVDLKRVRFKNIAQWNIAFGRTSAHNEYENKKETFVYWFGVPRYLIGGIIKDFFCIFLSLFSRKSLFLSLRRFFRKAGMIMEYRTYLNNKMIKEQRHAKG